MGGAALHLGNIAEMRTGEGKTLTGVLPAYLNGLTGQGVHVVTVNDYLAKRDAEWMGDRKSTRLNSSHANISYAVFCLKKKHPYLTLYRGVNIKSFSLPDQRLQDLIVLAPEPLHLFPRKLFLLHTSHHFVLWIQSTSGE